MYKHNLVFIASCLGMLLFGMVFLSLGTISVFIQEKFHADALSIASLASSLPLGMLAGSIIFGPIVDRYGYKFMLIICAGLILVAFESIAFAQTMAIMRVAFFLIGFGGGVLNGGTNALAADITEEGKGAKLSLLGVFFGVGALGMPLILGRLSGFYAYGQIISIIGMVVIIPFLYFLFIKFPEPKQKQGFPLNKAIALIKEPLLIMMGFILFLESALEGMVGNWTTSYLKSVSLTDKNALYALSCQVAAIAITRLFLSRFLKTISSRTVLYVCFSFIFIGAVILLNAGSFLSAVVAMIFFGAGFAAGFPVILGYVGELYAQMSGTAFSIVIVMALTGNTLLNYLVGVLSKEWGIGVLPFMLIVCVILMTLIFSFISQKISTVLSKV